MSDGGPDAGRSAARPEERKTETTLTTRIRINIPGSRPIPPVVVRQPVGEGETASDGSTTGETPMPDSAMSTTGTVELPAEPAPAAEEKASDWFAPRKSGPAKGGQGGGATNGAGMPGGSAAGTGAGGSVAGGAGAGGARPGAGASGGARPGAGRPGGVVGSMSVPGGSRSGGAGGPRGGQTNGAGLPGGATGGPVAPGHGGGTGSFDVTEALRGTEPRRDDLPYFSESGGAGPDGQNGQGGYGGPNGGVDYGTQGGQSPYGGGYGGQNGTAPAGPTGGPVTGDGPVVPPATDPFTGGEPFNSTDPFGGPGGPGTAGPGGPGGADPFGGPGGRRGQGGPGTSGGPGGVGGPGGPGTNGGNGNSNGFGSVGGPGAGGPNGFAGPGAGNPNGFGGQAAPGVVGGLAGPTGLGGPGTPGGAPGAGTLGPGGGLSDDTAILTPQKPAPEPGTPGYGGVRDNVSGHTVTSGIPVVPPGAQSAPKGPGTAAPNAAAPASSKPAKKKKKGRSKLALVGGLVIVAGAGAYGAGLLMNRSDVPKGTTVLGVDIGGGTRDDAVRKMDEAFGKSVDQALKLSVDGDTVSLRPDQAGLQLDEQATVSAAATSDYNPVSVIGSLFGRHRVIDPVMPVDGEKLRAALENAAGASGSATDGTIKFQSGKAVAVYGKAGKGIDVDQSVAAVEQAYRTQVETGTAATVTLPTTTKQPSVSNAEVDREMKAFAQPAMSAKITVQTDAAHSIVFSPENSLWKFLRVKAVNGKLVDSPDLEALQGLYGNLFDGVLITRGTGQKTAVTPQDVYGAVRQALLSKTDRDVTIETNPS